MATANEIMSLERRFWESIRDRDADAAAALLDDQSMSTSPWGIHHFDPAGYKAMAESGDAKLTSFEFSDEKVYFPLPDVAIASYRAEQSFTIGGEPREMTVYDTTTWVRKGGRWLATAHTETPVEPSAAARA